MKKRLLAILLTLAMVLTMLPTMVLAADSEPVLTEPKVTGLTVSCDDGEPVNILGDHSTVSIPVGSKPVFTVTFDKTELLNQVFVTSTKNGETKYLEATLQEGKYVTDDYFDPSNTNYIPGTIAVTYSKKSIAVTDNNKIGDVDLESLQRQLKASGIELINSVITDGSIEGKIVVDMGVAIEKVYVDAAISQFNADVGIDEDALNQWLGIGQELSTLASIKLNGADSPYEIFLQYVGKKTESLDEKDDGSNFLMILRDISGNKYTKMVIHAADDSFDLDDIADTMSGVNTVASALYDYYAIHKDMDDLRDEIDRSSTMSAEEKATAKSKIDDLENDKKWFTIGTTFIPMGMV